MNDNSKFNNLGFKTWLEIIASGDLPTKLRKSENDGLKSNANSGKEYNNKKPRNSENITKPNEGSAVPRRQRNSGTRDLKISSKAISRTQRSRGIFQLCGRL